MVQCHLMRCAVVHLEIFYMSSHFSKRVNPICDGLVICLTCPQKLIVKKIRCLTDILFYCNQSINLSGTTTFSIEYLHCYLILSQILTRTFLICFIDLHDLSCKENVFRQKMQRSCYSSHAEAGSKWRKRRFANH